jgi:hypothetical protein
MLPQSRPRSIEGHALDMDLGLHMRDKGMSSKDTSKEETPHNLTPKYVEELAEEVLGNNKTVEMFQAMAIVSMKMGNLSLEVKSLKNKLTLVEKEKQGSLK